MVHPSDIRALTTPNLVRLFRKTPSLASERHGFRGGSFLFMLRPARWLGLLTSPRRRPASPTGQPVYGRACPGPGLPEPRSAMTTRPNHLLPRQDFHLLACQRTKAALRSAVSIATRAARSAKIEVGTPVAGRPPHRSRRAVFPHRALHNISLTHLTGSGCSVETARRVLPQRPLGPVESAQTLSPLSGGEVSGSGAGAAHTRGPCNSSFDCADSAI